MFCVYELTDINGLFYIGKSEDLSQRIRVHKSDIKNGGTCSSTQLDINFQYKVLQEYENENDMLIGEQSYYDIYKAKYGDKCINKNRPLNTQKEYREAHAEELKEYYKKYREEHAEEIKETQKEYREAHAEEQKETHKKYYQEHKEESKEYHKKYREEHTEELKEYSKKYRQIIIECECGLKIKKNNKSQHLKTKKHINRINLLKIN